MKIGIKIQVFQDWGGQIISNTNYYPDSQSALLGVAQQLGFDIDSLFNKKIRA